MNKRFWLNVFFSLDKLDITKQGIIYLYRWRRHEFMNLSISKRKKNNYKFDCFLTVDLLFVFMLLFILFTVKRPDFVYLFGTTVASTKWSLVFLGP